MLPFLFESANPIQGRLRGKTDARLLLTGRDKMYLKAEEIGALTVPFDEQGLPLKMRVGRHLSALVKVFEIHARYFPESAVQVGGLPSYDSIESKGLGYYF